MAAKSVTVMDGPDLHQRIAAASERHGVPTKDVKVIRSSQVDSSRERGPSGPLLSEKGIER